jgi:hypothetical protein
MVVFYDAHVYKVGQRNTNVTEVATIEDLRALNLLQAINADSVLLFSDWRQVAQIKSLINRAQKYRSQRRSEIEEFVAEDDEPRESLIKIYQVPLDIGMRLSFMRLRRKSQAVPRRQRAVQYRDYPRAVSLNELRQHDPQHPPKRFVRKDLLDLPQREA